MLEDTEWTAWLLDLNQQRLGENYRFVSRILDDGGVRYHQGGCVSGFRVSKTASMLRSQSK